MTNKALISGQTVSMIGKAITCAETGKVFIGAVAANGFTTNYATSYAGGLHKAPEYLSDEGVDIRERRELLDRSKPFYCYVSSDGKHVGGWKGNVLGTITSATNYRLTRTSYIHGRTINFYRVTDVHGGLWTGRGNPGIAIKLHPSKVTRAELSDKALIAAGVSRLALEMLAPFETSGKDWKHRAELLELRRK
jgi:hypothetical protein